MNPTKRKLRLFVFIFWSTTLALLTYQNRGDDCPSRDASTNLNRTGEAFEVLERVSRLVNGDKKRATVALVPLPKEIERNNERIARDIKGRFENKDLVVVGKGPSAKYVDHAVGINQAVVMTDLTFLFMNDYTSFMGIENILSEIRYIFLPDYPHTTDLAHWERVNKAKDYRFACEMLVRLGFRGKFYIYQIQTSLNRHTRATLFSYSTTDVAVQLLTRLFKVASVHTFGYRRETGYHPFMEMIKGRMRRTPYDNETAPLAARVLETFDDIGINFTEPDLDVKSHQSVVVVGRQTQIFVH